MTPQTQTRPGSVAEVFGAFLKLGLTSFGGPVAHLGYFREELVLRRRWLDEDAYAELVALCQFLPGPTSSQVGFALGLGRASWGGALAAFLAFTLPSALILGGLALTAAAVDGPAAAGLVHGLKIVSVAIVAQAVWGMARSLCPDQDRAAIAVASVALLAVISGPAAMLCAIGMGMALGLWRVPGAATGGRGLSFPVSRAVGLGALAVFLLLLVLLPALRSSGNMAAMIDSFYRAGSLVFGGGHVVLPLLQAEVVATGQVSEDVFLSGYGLAQAVPGPLFTFAAWLGASMSGPPGALLALLALFLPGFLILIAALPGWTWLRRSAWTHSAVAGANAAVVGVLAMALYDPVFTTGITSRIDFALALIGLVALTMWKAPPWVVVALGALAGVGMALVA
ncbi:chromate efflux transporter [Falsirhodobacter sp. 20TX0035]|uniref:chromate efflux transporter n=1 Tax=Falsirhodobacter sp. 20TX0035 TaxID=3022019 RepID=UPI0023307222|nr:chromate efflux transporter [Falsirhodobacter sp. 20TX0035]MDB6452514.1 chromate efflux transporter [Falsirhodobacter sp. 20TX0035]